MMKKIEELEMIKSLASGKGFIIWAGGDTVHTAPLLDSDAALHRVLSRRF